MIVILKQNAKKEDIEKFTKQIEAKGIKVSPMVGEHTTILGFLGDTTRLDMDDIMAQSTLYTLEMWHKRPWLRRVAASILRLGAIWL